MLASQKIQFHTKTLLDFKENWRESVHEHWASNKSSLNHSTGQHIPPSSSAIAASATFSYCFSAMAKWKWFRRGSPRTTVAPFWANGHGKKGCNINMIYICITYNYEYYMNHMLWCCHNSCELWLANQYHSTSRKYMKLAPSCPYWSCTLCPMHLRSRQKSSF